MLQTIQRTFGARAAGSSILRVIWHRRLAHKACRDGYLVFYSRAAALFRDLAMARADGSLRNPLTRLARIDVLMVDDWAHESAERG